MIENLFDNMTPHIINGKKLLQKLFPETFRSGPLREWCNTFELVCQAAGKDVYEYEVQEYDEDDMDAEDIKRNLDQCAARLELIGMVFREGRKMDFTDTTVNKYYPYHQIIPDKEERFGFRLSCSGYVYVYDVAFLGARPFVFDSDTAKFIGTTFIDEYAQFLFYYNLFINL